MPRRRAVLATLAAALASGCLGGDEADGQTPGSVAGTPSGTIAVTSDAFDHGESIPERYTADGADVSPPLSIENVPAEAATLTLVVDDPDAPDPPFTHWLCWAIPPDTTSVPAALPQRERLPALGDAIQGENDFGELGYRGPAPPAGHGPHRYRFTVSALDSPLDLGPGTDRAAVDEAVAGSVVDRGRLVGTYDR